MVLFHETRSVLREGRWEWMVEAIASTMYRDAGPILDERVAACKGIGAPAVNRSTPYLPGNILLRRGNNPSATQFAYSQDF
jgi:hypothetical protein